jgi:endo-1,4-beta-xylanase
VGTKGFNYEYNLKYLKYLDSLGIPSERLIVAEAPHSAKIIYEKKGLELMKFHERNFEK